jgi:hypothetical protein|tara:strand:- start:32 stop:862 length:831 start_codon:yes stop_codon:yes gene_type:complete
MKCKIITLTPKLAKEYLFQNSTNRTLNKKLVSFYSTQMKNGQWKENGEPFIVDWDGEIKDGQHRLHACINANYTFNIPVIYEINPDVMDTIDTGKNRSLGDILKLNGITQPTKSSSVIKMILQHDKGNVAIQQSKGSAISASASGITNAAGLNYALKNKEYVHGLTKMSRAIYLRSTFKPFPIPLLSYFAHILTHKDLENPYINDFIKCLCGKTIEEGTGAAYVFNMVVKAKQNKTPLNAKYVLGIVIKAWNLYISGNPSIKFIKYDAKTPLPEIN